jgi:hypothetical protein
LKFMKGRKITCIAGTVLGLLVSLVLLIHLALLLFTDLTRQYHGFGIWIVIGILAAIAGLLLLFVSDEKSQK